ncbi:transcriptional regulator, MarR family [Paenibacillaceae bacterium GAS479]|nr:transcriptional regulator, MarR family [Paenibacillaceae bacterium GAS479]
MSSSDSHSKSRLQASTAPASAAEQGADASFRLDQQLCFALYACSKEVTRLYRPMLQELGLTYTQYVTLLSLWEEDGVAVKCLGKRLYLDSGTLTPLLKKLEASGFVNRVRDSVDERVLRVFLTEKGAGLREKASSIPERLCEVSSGMKLEELEELRIKVQQLNELIQHHYEEESEDGCH